MEIDQAELKQFKDTLALVDAGLREETGQESFAEHMITLQRSLRDTPHLVNQLLPEEVGALVAAVRRKINDDILIKAKPKKRAKKATAKQEQLALKDLLNADMDDLF